jgi:hypothetical protein
VIITDIELGLELIRIDAHQIVLAYCSTSPDDPGCAAAPGPEQLPDTGGTSSDSGSGYWSWVAAIGAALTLASVGGAIWLARRRLRER